jgi:two-component system OmpR family response regulator
MAGMSETGPEARLLVVEDEPNILELLAASLRLAGFEVATATGGLEAVQAVQRHRPDLVVLDVMLPDLDGFDVARRLRSGGTRTPVLFLTAKDATEDKVRGLSLGGDDYVTKPFSLEEVIARIRAVLRRTSATGPPPARPGCGPPTWSWTPRATRSGGPASGSSSPRPSSSCSAT